MKIKFKRIWIPILAIIGSVYFYNQSTTASDQMTPNDKTLEIATFAGGCFWCSESDLEKIDGVVEVISGYSGGRKEDATYKKVSAGVTGHYEAVQVHYDPSKVSYEKLLDAFWRHIDPTDSGGQFVDRGRQYRSAIFYHNEDQKRLAEASKNQLADSGRFNKPIATEILPLTGFYPAEAYHQDYYKTNPAHYNMYRSGSGRDQFIAQVWKDVQKNVAASSTQAKYSKPDDQTLRQTLTALEYKVTQKDGTEPPFDNKYWKNKQEGIYVDIVSGEPLFSSKDKFESGTGWPSFTQPLEPEYIVEKTDRSFFMVRTEVRSKYGDSHLGHVFPDGPPPTGLRYCINSASLRFIPKEELETKGYGEYVQLFKTN